MNPESVIAIDKGNTALKIYLLRDGQVVHVRRLAPDDSDAVLAAVEEWSPRAGVFCSVGHKDPRLLETLRIALGGRLLILSHSTPLPIAVEYSTPATLGLDRVALAAGAWELFPGESLVVVDAGTAVTLDVVGETGAFKGGRISPGMALRFRSLHDYTSLLPLLTADGEVPVAGDATDTSIRSGVVRGLAGEIESTFHQYSKNYGCTRILLSGGDAETLAAYLPSEVSCTVVGDLMARGLYAIYRYNENTD